MTAVEALGLFGLVITGLSMLAALLVALAVGVGLLAEWWDEHRQRKADEQFANEIGATLR